jgi:TolA-binding protein
VTPAVLAVFMLGVAVVVAVAAFVAAPLWSGVERLAEAGGADERVRWERQKRQALLAIKETELDYQMGKLSEEDLQRMRTRFEQQAMEAIDALEREQARPKR